MNDDPVWGDATRQPIVGGGSILVEANFGRPACRAVIAPVADGEEADAPFRDPAPAPFLNRESGGVSVEEQEGGIVALRWQPPADQPFAVRRFDLDDLDLPARRRGQAGAPDGQGLRDPPVLTSTRAADASRRPSNLNHSGRTPFMVMMLVPVRLREAFGKFVTLFPEPLRIFAGECLQIPKFPA